MKKGFLFLLMFVLMASLVLGERVYLDLESMTLDQYNPSTQYCDRAEEEVMHYATLDKKTAFVLGYPKELLGDVLSIDSAYVVFRQTQYINDGSIDLYASYNRDSYQCSDCMSYDFAFQACDIHIGMEKVATYGTDNDLDISRVITSQFRSAYDNDKFFAILLYPTADADGNINQKIAGSSYGTSDKRPYIRVDYTPKECDSGLCCDNGEFRPSSYVCDPNYDDEYYCPYGTDPGDDVYYRVKVRKCSGSSASCTGSTEWQTGSVYDYCSSNEYCTPGDPSCNSCGYHEYTACYNDDSYWYDNCDNRQDLRQDCGEDSCDDPIYYCNNGDVHADTDCYVRGCSNGNCFANPSEVTALIEDCGEDSCSDYGVNYCFDGDVYKNRTCNDRGCADAACTLNENFEEVLVEDCVNGCSNGVCLECSPGDCCDNGVFRGDDHVCADLDFEYGCVDGTDYGDDVYARQNQQYCSGSSSICDGAVIPTGWVVHQDCDVDGRCQEGLDSCQLAECVNDTDCAGQICVDNSCVDRGVLNPAMLVDNQLVWSISGWYHSSEVVDFKLELQNALESCVPDQEGYCNIELKVSTGSNGIVELSDLLIKYNGTTIYPEIYSINGTDPDEEILIEVMEGSTIQVPVDSNFDELNQPEWVTDNPAVTVENGFITIDASDVDTLLNPVQPFSVSYFPSSFAPQEEYVCNPYPDTEVCAGWIREDDDCQPFAEASISFIYGDRRGCVVNGIQSSCFVGDAKIHVDGYGDNFYLAKDFSSWPEAEQIIDCDFADLHCNINDYRGEEIIKGEVVVYSAPSDISSFAVASKYYTECSGEIAYAYVFVGWDDQFANMYSVNCLDENDCGEGQVCDTSGNWDEWHCIEDPCPTMNCDSYCNGDTLFASWGCALGECSYMEYNCNDNDGLGEEQLYCNGTEVWKRVPYEDWSCQNEDCRLIETFYLESELVEECPETCNNGVCENDPCNDPRFCSDYCDEDTWYEVIACGEGVCSHQFTDCNYLDTVTEPERYCDGNVLRERKEKLDYGCTENGCEIISTEYLDERYIANCNNCYDGRCIAGAVDVLVTLRSADGSDEISINIVVEEQEAENTIELTSCQDLNQSDTTYVLNQDIFCTDDIYINNHSITLDCNGHSISAVGLRQNNIMNYGGTIYYENFTLRNCNLASRMGLYIRNANNNNIVNVNITEVNTGITLQNTLGNSFRDVNIDTTNIGIWSYDNARSNSYTNVRFINSRDYDMYLWGNWFTCLDYYDNVIGSDGKPIVYMNHTLELRDVNNLSSLILCGADDSVLDNITVSNDGRGVALYLISSDDVIISNSTFLNMGEGVSLINSDDSIISNSDFENVRTGIHFGTLSKRNIVRSVNILNGHVGVYLWGVENNGVYESYFWNNSNHVALYNAPDNTLAGNVFTGNGSKLSVTSSNNVWIYDNFFNDTIINLDSSTVIWNTSGDGYRNYGFGPIGGNYWANDIGAGYSEVCDDNDFDGFCDLPYDVEDGTVCESNCSNNIDYLPLKNLPLCIPHWVLNETWSECVNGIQFKNWYDINGCFGTGSVPEWSYQENSNKQICDGSWAVTYPCESAFDGNWSSYGADGTLYLNYTKPNNYLKTSFWQIKDSGINANLTIPESCWNYDENILQLRVSSSVLSMEGTISWECFDGSWVNLRTHSGLAQFLAYEEAMWWHLSDSINQTCGICEPNWVLNETWSECDISDNQYANYYDLNDCGEYYPGITYQENANVTIVGGGVTGTKEHPAYLELTYTKPRYARYAKWKVKHGSSDYDAYEIIIPNECFELDNLKLRLNSYDDLDIPARESYLNCYNGSSWLRIGEHRSCGWTAYQALIDQPELMYDGDWETGAFKGSAQTIWNTYTHGDVCSIIWEEAVIWDSRDSQSCNYCSENINEFYTGWSDCYENDTKSRVKFYVDSNYNDCCNVTGLESDCSVDSMVDELEWDSCDYCTPSLVNTTIGWYNVSLCMPNDIIEQEKVIMETDENNCNKTVDRNFTFRRNVSCDFASELFSGGSGTQEDPYQISDCEELQNMRYALNSSFILVNDIDCFDTISWNDGRGFVPIGDGSSILNHFTGGFDGKGYTINDLYINASRDYVGLFSFVDRAIITNMSIVDATIISDNDYAGALSGAIQYSILNNISVERLDVKGRYFVGGAVGAIYYSNVSSLSVTGVAYGLEQVGLLSGSVYDSRLTYTSAEGSITCVKVCGGLVGEVRTGQTSLIKSSWAIVELTKMPGGIYDQVGGFIGELWYGYIEDCWVDAVLNGLQGRYGGFVGQTVQAETGIKNSYAITNNLPGANRCFVGYNQRGTNFSNNYYNSNSCTIGDPYAAGKSTNEMRQRSTYNGWDFYGVWQIEEGNDYPKHITFRDFIVRGFFSGGSGTQEDPYQISDCEELQNMRYALNSSFILVNDIDCSDAGSFNGGKEFEPIGNDKNLFTGTFNGNNYLIENLDIDTIEPDDVYSSAYIGLFGRCRNVVIENVRLNNVNIIGRYFAGSLAGYIRGEYYKYSIIRNITATNISVTTYDHDNFSNYAMADVGGLVGGAHFVDISNISLDGIEIDGIATDSETYGFGGMVGNFIGNAKDVVVKGCLVDAIGYSYVGGIIGMAGEMQVGPVDSMLGCEEFGGVETLSNCAFGSRLDDLLADCEVHGSRFVGGLIGAAIQNIAKPRIIDSFSYGNVYGYLGSSERYIGGFAGSGYGNITNCISFGNVTAPDCDYVGGFSGEGGASNSFAEGNVVGNKNVGGFTGQYGRKDPIINSYSHGDVQGNENVGGFVGENFVPNGVHQGTVVNCYSSGEVSGDVNVGSFIGHNDEYSTYKARVSNSYSKESLDYDFVGYDEGIIEDSFEVSDENLKKQATFTGWDFDHVWGIEEGCSYTYLKSLIDFVNVNTGCVLIYPFYLNLTEGWNLVSIPYNVSDNSVASVFRGADSVFHYNKSRWYQYDEDFSNLDKVSTGKGYWVKVSEDMGVNVSGTLINDKVSLVVDWNMIGVYDDVNVAELSKNITVIYSYDNGEWKSWMKGRPFNDFYDLEVGKGYWVRVDEDCNI